MNLIEGISHIISYYSVHGAELNIVLGFGAAVLIGLLGLAIYEGVTER